MRHSHASLEAWSALTTGVPAALADPPGSEDVARRLALLAGCGAATLGTSTLHLMMDFLCRPKVTRSMSILWDEAVYPVARWSIERAQACGAKAQPFGHFSPASLALAVAQAVRCQRRPLVVTDGHCPGCGRAAPLADYCAAARRAEGLVLVDDTQAIGLSGPAADGLRPGGGGSLRRAGVGGPAVVWVASLAKAFGAPIAALAADEERVAEFRLGSETRVHTSPPSAASIAALSRALGVNAAWGDSLRRRLVARVRRFRQGLSRAGLSASGGEHPVQLVGRVAGVEPLALHEALSRAGIRTVLLRARCRSDVSVAFAVTAAHSEDEIDLAVQVLAAAVRRLSGPRAAATGGA